MSSVRREITPATIANEIRMARQDPTRRDIVVIFVEGSTDQKFFNKIFSSHNADIKTVPEGPSGIGRTGVQNVVNQLLSQNIDRLIGIRDADFSRLLQTELAPIFL
jgi:hypothetical protein